ncbi:UDP-glycosyltransferase UGT5 [Drosophila subpulchrella]|uniref:UDP-glycosyltransferase UGT5 n=1 Tax=Drosophila subpulchrella TaxID=1486046 RepID=UPI0018A17F58|nr:UDP-glycosyltransferase UGT5 [Drosophila subpulchrella]
MVEDPSRFFMLALTVSYFISGSQGANILGLFPSPSPSHLIISMSAAKVLAEQGHNVTVVTVLEPTITHKNIHVVQVPMTKEEIKQRSETIGAKQKNNSGSRLISILQMSGQMDSMLRKMADALKDERVKDLYLNKGNHFDLVISGYFMNDYQLGFARKVNAPVIVLAPSPPGQMLNSLIGNPSDPIEKDKNTSFAQRLDSFITNLFYQVFVRQIDQRNRRFYKELFADDSNMPDYSEMLKNTSLVFFCSHAASEGSIRPNVPAAIEIGGIQIKDKPDALPKSLEEFLGNATDGAILLSLGSNVQGSHIKSDTVEKMFNVLSKLKQRVIWKWEDLDKIPGKSNNILYSRWLPQDDILAHPNIKLFINHAGKGGITESQYHGKPMLSLPVFGDQPSNAFGMVKNGFGLTLSLLNLEEKPFKDAIEEILSNPQYSQKVALFSSLYRDRPNSARDSLIYWTEYVIRHHGAAHLQSPLVHMDFITANNLDIYVLFTAIFVGLIIILKASVQLFFKMLVPKFIKITKVKKH